MADTIKLDRLYDYGRRLLAVDNGEDPAEANPEYTRAVVELVADVDPNLTGFAEERLPAAAERLGLDVCGLCGGFLPHEHTPEETQGAYGGGSDPDIPR